MSSVHAKFSMQRGAFVLKVEFDTPSRGVTALFGQSGSGKTTLLRCIAGLEREKGELNVNGETWQSDSFFAPVHERSLGYVFQEASLFPHLSVRANLEYGYQRISPEARKVKIEQVIEWLGLGNLLDRRDPSSLSGGERQRVAIGRALLVSPKLLLMDEPLAALDNMSKQEIMPYLEYLHRELEIPVIYVSHALDEVVRLADHLVLMDKGSVLASGSLAETISRLDLPTAHFDDAGAVIAATVAEQDDTYSLTRLKFSGGELWVGKVAQPDGTTVRARVLARDVSIVLQRPGATSINNILAAQIIEIQDEGSAKVNIRMRVGEGHTLLARITRRSCDQLELNIGMGVYAQVKSVALMPGCSV